MSDFRTLSDVFTELERRADSASAQAPGDGPPAPHRSRAPLIAATVIAVSALAVGTAFVASSGGSSRPQAAGASQRATSSAAPPTAADGSTAATPSTTTSAAFRIPHTAQELASRFRTVLGDTATFVVSDSTDGSMQTTVPAVNSTDASLSVPMSIDDFGAYIVGTLTAAGVTGGFDLQIFQAATGDKASCDDPDRSLCSVTTLADGSSLALGHEPLEGAANGITYQANLIRPDGVEFLMHVSNERDPKGDSTVLAPQPPLTADQMTAIVTSDKW